MLKAFLRALDIVLLFLLGGVSVLTALQQVRVTFSPSRGFIAGTLAVLSLLGAGYAAYDSLVNLEPATRIVPTIGVVLEGTANFGVYWDVTGTREVKEIAWGTLEPGQVGNSTFYVRNEATSEIYCAVTWIEETWQPPDASQYFELTWNFEDEPLKPNRARKVKLELHVSPEIHGVGEFSFNIIITGQGEPFTG